VKRFKPIKDSENEIAEVIQECAGKYDLVIIIGGSGGGHRYVSSLSEDYTHTAILRSMNSYSAVEIYGKNGHLWSKIVCGGKDTTRIINVPGPYVEAVSAAKSLMGCYMDGIEEDSAICEKVSEAVISNYSSDAGIKCVKI
jgi:molybdopterin biosynthesis enzyme MoaB